MIGLGNIGYQIALKSYKALGMRIAYHDPFPKSPEQEAVIDAKHYAKLEDMLAIVDCFCTLRCILLLDAQRAGEARPFGLG